MTSVLLLKHTLSTEPYGFCTLKVNEHQPLQHRIKFMLKFSHIIFLKTNQKIKILKSLRTVAFEFGDHYNNKIRNLLAGYELYLIIHS